MLKLKAQSLKWALEHALVIGDTDIFPSAFEFEAINDQWMLVENWLSKENILEWNVRPSLRCLTPKHRYGFRIATQLDPADFLVFTSLVYEIGNDLERTRIPKEDGIVHSYRFGPDASGTMYDKNYNYHTFHNRSIELVDEGAKWVVIADIADFYPRLYHHRIENALRSCTSKINHAISIDRMLSAWNESNSYGIPVGPAACCLIAECALDDVDRALLSEGAKYTRYSDDFRIFCGNKLEAYERLAFLANILFENHGLTLQQHKTRILPVEEFTNRYLSTETDTELNSLNISFTQFLAELGIKNPYEQIRLEDLSSEQLEQISKLNLQELLEEQSKLDEIDMPLTRFVLRRLAQLGSSDSLDTVLDNITSFYPVLREVALYIRSLSNLDAANKRTIGDKILKLLEGSVVSHLEFHRMWLLSVFTDDRAFNHEDQFSRLYSNWQDELSQRELILALGKSHQSEWFRMRKRKVFNLQPWQRRAFLLAGSCLPDDERRNWYRSLSSRLDIVELAIIKWASKNTI